MYPLREQVAKDFGAGEEDRSDRSTRDALIGHARQRMNPGAMYQILGHVKSGTNAPVRTTNWTWAPISIDRAE